MPQAGNPRDDLYVIPGVVPTAAEMPSGCRFHPRCSYAVDACITEPVPLIPVPNGTGDSAGPALDDPAVRCIRSAEIVLPGAS